MTKVTALKALVHPLVVMQMSEHYSRTKVQQASAGDKVYGAILGRQIGRQVEAINSFAFKMYTEEMSGTVTFNEMHMISRAQQYMEVFPELQVIGAYCSGESGDFTPDEKAMLIKLALSMRGVEKATHIDSPLFLKLNAATAGTSTKNFASIQLPLFAYEGDVVDVERYNSVEWVLVSEDSERIGVNHIARLSTKDGKDEGSASTKQSKAQQSALSMLSNRVELILAYLEKVQNGELQPDFEILKEANMLAQRLKTLDRYALEFETDFDKEDTSISMFSLLPKMTTLLGNMTQVWAKVSQMRADVSTSDEGYSLKSISNYPYAKDIKPLRFKGSNSKTGNDMEDDYLDEEDVEYEMGGPKRKIHSADSQGGYRQRRKGQKRVDRLFRPSELVNPTGASSSNTVSTDHEMEPAHFEWGPQQVAASSSYVPDAPMPPAASNARSDENVDEPL